MSIGGLAAWPGSIHRPEGFIVVDLLGQRIAKLSDRIHTAHDITQSVQTFRLEEARCDRTAVSALAKNVKGVSRGNTSMR